MDIAVGGLASPGSGPSTGPLPHPAPVSSESRAASLRAAIERRLDELVPDDPGPQGVLRQAMRWSLLAPGKRLRPLLAMAAARELGADPADALDAGCALEMLHAASLVLDDLPCMDDAQLRRGRPTLHVAYGEDVAILASIALLSRAFQVVATQRSLPASVRGAVSAALAEAIGADGLAAGQIEDLRGAPARASAADAQRCNLRKTGALFLAAVEVGGAVARAPAARRERLGEFALHLGCAFQIRDDLLDATARPEQVGKDTGRDGERRTIVGLLGVERAAREMRAHLAAAHRAAAGPGRGAPADSPLAAFLHAAFGDELRAALA
ncbi:MAG TPA: polyprenyl synthetase family protein [Burkholderiaceae bacterium]|nr:polyprenyl synthetase family protein [Burkholderiaceae bacterium]